MIKKLARRILRKELLEHAKTIYSGAWLEGYACGLGENLEASIAQGESLVQQKAVVQ